VNKKCFLTAFAVCVAFAVPVRAETPCSLPYYPVAVGDVNQYRTTTKTLDASGAVVKTKSTVTTDTVEKVSSDRYVTTTRKLGTASQTVWLCTEEGLRAKVPEYPGVTVETSGVSIPAHMGIGDVWTQTYQAGSPDKMSRMTTINRVVGREMVAVQAGTFEAFRVNYEIDIVMGDEPPTVTRGSKWFAEGIGLVKVTSALQSTEDDEKRSVEVEIELLKRSIRKP